MRKPRGLRWPGLLAGVLLALALATGVGTAASQAAPPANTAPPSVTGTAQAGRTLTATTGSWSGDTPMTFGFQWQRCGASGGTCGDIAGATSASYTVVAADVGGSLRVVVTATNASGSAAAASAPTAVVTAAAVPPSPQGQPNPRGEARVGRTLTIANGTWSGDTPITFTYQWQRCAPAPNCGAIPGATGQSYTVVAADVGLRLRALVTGTNRAGSATIASNQTAAVVAQSGAPVLTVAPAIANGASVAVNQTLTGTSGSWTGTAPISFAYGWNRCDAAGSNCAPIPGGTSLSYQVTSADVGRTLRLAVRASNSAGSTVASSLPTAVVAGSSLVTGGIRLPDGKVSIPASNVSLPARLVISGVSFSPMVVRSRAGFTARFRVTDTRGYVVRDALVYVIGLPYGWVRNAPEVVTGSDGYAVVNLFPTAALPLRAGAMVFFVRARKQGDDLLAGVSTRRLVQVRLGR